MNDGETRKIWGTAVPWVAPKGIPLKPTKRQWKAKSDKGTKCYDNCKSDKENTLTSKRPKGGLKELTKRGYENTKG